MAVIWYFTLISTTYKEYLSKIKYQRKAIFQIVCYRWFTRDIDNKVLRLVVTRSSVNSVSSTFPKGLCRWPFRTIIAESWTKCWWRAYAINFIISPRVTGSSRQNRQKGFEWDVLSANKQTSYCHFHGQYFRYAIPMISKQEVQNESLSPWFEPGIPSGSTRRREPRAACTNST